MDNKVFTMNGCKISYDHLIFITGYSKVYPVIKDKCIKNRTNAFCSAPIQDSLWENHVMVWETKNPYLYFRTTKDNRVIAGGLDEEKNQVEYDEQEIMDKAIQIAKEVEGVFPHLDINVEYAWNALFYGSKIRVWGKGDVL